MAGVQGPHGGAQARPAGPPPARARAAPASSSRVRREGGAGHRQRPRRERGRREAGGRTRERVLEQPADLDRPDRQHPAVGHHPVEGVAGQRDVRRQRVRRDGGDLLEVGGCTVPTSPRTIGPVRAASPSRRALSRAAVSSGRNVSAGSYSGSSARGRGEHLAGLGHQGDQVVGAVRERGVVERPPLLRHPHGAAAEVGDQLLGEAALVGAGGDAEDAARQSRQVDGGAGEGHRRVHARPTGRRRATASARTSSPWRPEVCTTY